MRSIVRMTGIAISLFSLLLVTTRCGNLNTTPNFECGEGYLYTAGQGCVKQELLCNPPCTTDEICRTIDDKPTCVARVALNSNQQPIECSIICRPGEVCKDGRCVSVPCSPACGAGFICSQGKCVLRQECNPPCLQYGFVCVNGLCEKICVPACETGKVCTQGVCEKACEPACQNGFFCRGGNCVKLEDSDNDKYPADRDCDDKDPEIHPGATEICDGKDNDCDGKVDNIEAKPCYSGASKSLGNGPCVAGVTVCKDKKLVCFGEITPQTEACNGKDDDCDGVIDNDATCPTDQKCVNGACK